MIIFVRKHYDAKSSFALSILLQTSIWLRAFLAAIGNLARMKPRLPENAVINTCIIGDDIDIKRAESILTKQDRPHREVSQITPGGDLKKAIEEGGHEEVIFCEGRFSYKDIMVLMQQLPGSISFRIHSSGSNCIVGSDSKHTSGSVLT